MQMLKLTRFRFHYSHNTKVEKCMSMKVYWFLISSEMENISFPSETEED